MHAKLHGYGSDHNTAVHTIAQAMAAKNNIISNLKQAFRNRDSTVGFLDKEMVLAGEEAKTLRFNANKGKNSAVALKAQLATSNEERDRSKKLLDSVEARQEREDGLAEEGLIKAHEKFGDVIRKNFKEKREKKEEAKRRKEKEELAKKEALGKLAKK